MWEGLFRVGAGGQRTPLSDRLRTHEWVPGSRWDLIVTMVDATNEHYSMFFVDEEGSASSLRGVREVIEARGLFSSLYTDRGSHYWLARYWAEELAAQTADAELAGVFAPVAAALADGESAIVAELLGVQGKPADIGGYYRPDAEKVAAVMRPSATLNAVIDSLA